MQSVRPERSHQPQHERTQQDIQGAIQVLAGYKQRELLDDNKHLLQFVGGLEAVCDGSDPD